MWAASPGFALLAAFLYRLATDMATDTRRLDRRVWPPRYIAIGQEVSGEKGQLTLEPFPCLLLSQRLSAVKQMTLQQFNELLPDHARCPKHCHRNTVLQVLHSAAPRRAWRTLSCTSWRTSGITGAIRSRCKQRSARSLSDSSTIKMIPVSDAP